MASRAKSLPRYGSLGKEVQIEHLKAYVVKPDDATDQAVIVILDACGAQMPNIRYMSDLMCLAGYIAICPDFFAGETGLDPAAGQFFRDCQKEKKDKRKLDIVLKEVKVFLKYLKEECGAQSIGIVVFCWGGEAALRIALQNPEIKAVVSFYGMPHQTEDNYVLKCPTLFIFGERDAVIPAKQIKLMEKCLVDFAVKIFPEQTHGFAHCQLKDIEETDKIHVEEARKNMLLWLKKYMSCPTDQNFSQGEAEILVEQTIDFHVT